jgi:ribosomal protein S18 acetylase RimI-like enzyme
VSSQGWARVLVDQDNGDAPRVVLLVAEDLEGQLVGLVYGRTAHDDDPTSIAEVRALYVAPTCRRQGIGAALLRAAALELNEIGFSTVRLEVLSANLDARAFYEDMGGLEVGKGTFDEDGHLLPVTIYEWSSEILAN